MVDTDIARYYARGGELTRLTAGRGRLEFLRTWDVLARVLPPAPARILDVGGATGAYAVPLAAAGYQVHVIDPIPEQVEQASAQPGITAAVGDARHLDERDESADAVLMLGPLYHLTDRADRVQAWREAGRVARPNAPIIGATISRFANFFVAFTGGYATDPDFQKILRRSLSDGVHLNVSDERTWFATAYYHHPAEIPAEVTDAGLVLDRTVAVETSLSHADGVNDVLDDPIATAALLDRLRDIEAEPSLHGSSAHLLTIAHRA
jgi:SAM-dependent methyltransferase